MKVINLSLFLFSSFLVFNSLQAQPWELIKEREGIKVYTKKNTDNPIKSFRGEAVLHTQMAKVCYLIGNGENFDWWEESIKNVEVLTFIKDKLIRYYLVYDVPWPLTDRDLCVEATIKDDPVTGERIVEAKPIFGVIPEKPNYIRIKNYSQRWIVTPIDKDHVKVILEGYADPGGIVPSWLYNMVITETPLKVIRNVRVRVE